MDSQQKTILIISTSQRKNGNSDTLAQQFRLGAEAAGHRVEYVSLAKKEIRFCVGCFVK